MRAIIVLVGFLCLAPTVAAEPRHVSGEILVRYRPDVGEAEIAAIHASSGARVLEVIEKLGIYRLALPVGRSATRMRGEFSDDPRCEHVELNYIGEGGDLIPNDTSFGDQWHLNNTGQGGGTLDADIDAVEAWDITTGSDSVVVAVLDSGIDSDHPELLGRVLPGFDFVNEDSDPEADHAHGAVVTGILAANADNSFAVAGIDHSAKILPVKVLGSANLGTLADLIEGLTYAADQGADVISMSLINYPVAFSFLEDALQYARDSGAILIACAGNDGIGDADVSGPGASPLTISVGATTRNDARASFSGTGSALDVVAPGSSISTIAYNTAVDTSSVFSGCSAATPIVAGITSLLLAEYPSLTHDEVRSILTQSAEDLVGPPNEDTPGRDDFFGHGRVNLHSALLAGPPTAVPVMPTPALWLLLALLLLAGSGVLKAAVTKLRGTGH